MFSNIIYLSNSPKEKLLKEAGINNRYLFLKTLIDLIKPDDVRKISVGCYCFFIKIKSKTVFKVALCIKKKLFIKLKLGID